MRTRTADLQRARRMHQLWRAEQQQERWQHEQDACMWVRVPPWTFFFLDFLRCFCARLRFKYRSSISFALGPLS